MLLCHIFLMNCNNISIVNKINILTTFAYLEDFTDCAISREIDSSYLHLKEALRRLKMAAEEAGTESAEAPISAALQSRATGS